MPVSLLRVLIQPIGRGTTHAFAMFVSGSNLLLFKVGEEDDTHLERITRETMIGLAWFVEDHVFSDISGRLGG